MIIFEIERKERKRLFGLISNWAKAISAAQLPHKISLSPIPNPVQFPQKPKRPHLIPISSPPFIKSWSNGPELISPSYKTVWNSPQNPRDQPYLPPSLILTLSHSRRRKSPHGGAPPPISLKSSPHTPQLILSPNLPLIFSKSPPNSWIFRSQNIKNPRFAHFKFFF